MPTWYQLACALLLSLLEGTALTMPGVCCQALGVCHDSSRCVRIDTIHQVHQCAVITCEALSC